MKTDIAHPVATVSLVLLRGESPTNVTAVIGQPYVVDTAEARCPAKLEGIDPQYPDQCGSDLFQALGLAMRLLHSRLVDQLDKGHRLLDSKGHELDREALDLMFTRGGR